MYSRYLKRGLDFLVSLMALLILSPLFVILTVTGAIAMKGNPFFCQKRPGRIDPKSGQEKIFTLIKFRTMSNEKDKDGVLLPDKERVNAYGIRLRNMSLDELPELINILKGDMSLIGPRPLLIRYLPYYRKNERRRHEVRPGLTGLAQINGRNACCWEKRFEYDLYYVNHVSFSLDVYIFILSIFKVLKRENIVVHEDNPVKALDVERKQLDEKTINIWC